MRILPILQVDVRMAHPVLGSTMKFVCNEERCQAGRASNQSCRPRTGDITSMNSRHSCIPDMSLLPEVLARLVQELMQIRDGVTPAVALHPTRAGAVGGRGIHLPGSRLARRASAPISTSASIIRAGPSSGWSSLRPGRCTRREARLNRRCPQAFGATRPGLPAPTGPVQASAAYLA